MKLKEIKGLLQEQKEEHSPKLPKDSQVAYAEGKGGKMNKLKDCVCKKPGIIGNQGICSRCKGRVKIKILSLPNKKTKTPTQEIQYLGLMLAASTVKDKTRIKAIIKRLKKLI